MSTRMVITYQDAQGAHSVYKHHDGYPTGALPLIEAAARMAKGGFEAADHGACFVAVAKDGKPGGVYLTKPGTDNGQDYDYLVTADPKDGDLEIVIKHFNQVVYAGGLADAVARAKQLDRK